MHSLLSQTPVLLYKCLLDVELVQAAGQKP
jgi:hypothetical protein